MCHSPERSQSQSQKEEDATKGYHPRPK
uniref:Uncharacterized protein n=1 Tax=Arundo donax TaxID=35708 RepID=A0A0A9AM55_ARUDO